MEELILMRDSLSDFRDVIIKNDFPNHRIKYSAYAKVLNTYIEHVWDGWGYLQEEFESWINLDFDKGFFKEVEKVARELRFFEGE
jgi:hypothetical protein